MREIKFRAWHKGQLKMYLVKKLELVDKRDDQILLATDTKIGYIIANLRQCELMQYTGLKDRNGVEIYERDIVNTKCCGEWHKAIVEYRNGSFYVDGEHWVKNHIIGDFITEDEIEVIGNIYENPELLEELLNNADKKDKDKRKI